MNELILYIYISALSQGVNPHMALSVAMVESGLNPKAVGKKEDIGLFQVRHNLVKESRKDLLNPYVNTTVGIEFLVNAKKSCKDFPNNSWVVCYNRGVAGGKRIEHPTQDSYYKKVNSVYSCLKKYKYKDLVNKNINKECLRKH